MRCAVVVVFAAAAFGACVEDADPPVLVEPPLPPCGDPSAGGWDDTYRYPGIPGHVTAMVRLADGRIAVAGGLEVDVGATLTAAAIWDGQRWQRLGTGLSYATTMTVDDEGVAWAAQDDRILRLDGEAWTVVGTANAPVGGLAAVDGGVAAYGYFDRIDDVAMPGLAIHDGQTWRAGPFSGSIYTLARTEAGYCVGGYLLYAGHLSHRAMCWDGETATKLGRDIDGYPLALARSPTGEWWMGSAGWFDTPIGPYRLGSDGYWRTVDGGVPGSGPAGLDEWIHAIAFVGEDVIVVGAGARSGGAIARWNRRTGWRTPGGAPVRAGTEDPQINALVVDGDRVHLAGHFALAGDTLAANVATIATDGSITAWTGGALAASPIVRPHALAGADGLLLVAGPVATGDGGESYAATFDGTVWRAIPPRSHGIGLRHALVRTNGNLVVSGNHLEEWDGTSWIRHDAGAGGSPLVADDRGRFYWRQRRDGHSNIVRVDDGNFDWLDTLDGDILDFAIHDGHLLAVNEAATGVRALWRRENGIWTEVPGAPVGLEQVVTLADLGLIGRTATGIYRADDDDTWTAISPPAETADVAFDDVAACATGLFTAQSLDGGAATVLWFYDAAAARWIELDRSSRADGFPLALGPGGLFVGSFWGDPADHVGLHRWAF
jgi:hypothetical protein